MKKELTNEEKLRLFLKDFKSDPNNYHIDGVAFKFTSVKIPRFGSFYCPECNYNMRTFTKISSFKTCSRYRYICDICDYNEIRYSERRVLFEEMFLTT